jgi:hypothetical protein
MKFFLLILNLCLSIYLSAQTNSESYLKLNVNDTLFYEEIYNAETSQIIGGKTQKTYNSLKYFYNIAVENVSVDTTYGLILEYSRIIFDTKTENTSYSFDTDIQNSQDSSEAFIFYKALLNRKFVFRIDKNYFPVEFKRNKAQFAELIDSVGIHEVREKSYYTFYSNSNIYSKYCIINKSISNVDLKENNIDTISIDIYKIYNFEYPENLNQDLINNISGKVISDKNFPNSVNGVYILYDLNGNFNSNFSKESVSGIIKTYNSKINSSGNVIVKYSKTGLPAYLWPIKIEVENSFKLLKINSKFVDN